MTSVNQLPFEYASRSIAGFLHPSAQTWAPDTRRSLLVIGARTRESWEAAAAAAGGRCLGSVTHEDALSTLSRIADVDAIILDCDGGEAHLPSLSPVLERFAREHRTPVLISTSLSHLDRHMSLLDACLWTDAPIEWLCDPGVAQQADAVSALLKWNRAASSLQDSSRDRHAKLDQLSHEVQRLSRTLEALRNAEGPGHIVPEDASQSMRPGGSAAHGHRGGWPMIGARNMSPVGNADTILTAATVRDLLRARRLRDQFFGEGLFADPAWDMILDLMAARLSGERVSVSSLCIAAAVPPTTALRWIRHLTQSGIFERRPDTQDGRRVFIALSDKTAAAVHRWFAASAPTRRDDDD